MRAPIVVAISLLAVDLARAAEEPSGCDKFKWNIEREQPPCSGCARCRDPVAQRS